VIYLWPYLTVVDIYLIRSSTKLAVLNTLKAAGSPLSLAEILQFPEENIAERTLRRWLAVWVEQGIVVRTGNKRSTRYAYQREYIYPSILDKGFLANVPADRRATVLQQIRDLWTHTSTALEGNTLTLGDTHAVLALGLTVSGKPLAEHQEIVGHAKAIDILYQSLYVPLDKELICNLHRAVQTQIVHDIYQPVGDWKIEKNGVYSVTRSDQQVYIEYADPSDVDMLMDSLIQYINGFSPDSIDLENAANVYARVHMGFVHIHPFCDGNGRMARLIANLLLLKAGLPPLVISQSMRRQYISCLAEYQLATGKLDEDTGVWPDADRLKEFTEFCQSAYTETKALIQQARQSRRKEILPADR